MASKGKALCTAIGNEESVKDRAKHKQPQDNRQAASPLGVQSPLAMP